MKDGNWIPIDKNLAKFFPDRKFSEIEAAFSLTLDYDNNKSASIAGYSKLWGWSRSKVRLFLDNMRVDILYPEDVSKKQNQKGQIERQIKDRSETDKRQIRMVNTKGSQVTKDRSKTDEEQISDRSPDSTSKPNINLKPKTIKKTFVETSEEVQLSKRLADLILNQSPDNYYAKLEVKNKYQSWAKSIDHMIRIDKRSVEQIRYLIDWSQRDSFWSTNILSTKKLREKFDQLVLRVKEGKNKIKSTDQSKPSFQTNPSIKEIYKRKQEKLEHELNIDEPSKKRLLNGPT